MHRCASTKTPRRARGDDCAAAGRRDGSGTIKKRPLIVGHQSANQGCSPQRTALNQFTIPASIDLSTRPSVRNQSDSLSAFAEMRGSARGRGGVCAKLNRFGRPSGRKMLILQAVEQSQMNRDYAFMSALRAWTVVLRCPHCGRTGSGAVSEDASDKSRFRVDGISSGFVVALRRHSMSTCNSSALK